MKALAIDVSMPGAVDGMKPPADGCDVGCGSMLDDDAGLPAVPSSWSMASGTVTWAAALAAGLALGANASEEGSNAPAEAKVGKAASAIGAPKSISLILIGMGDGSNTGAASSSKVASKDALGSAAFSLSPACE
jgi:hypothetical protein